MVGLWQCLQGSKSKLEKNSLQVYSVNGLNLLQLLYRQQHLVFVHALSNLQGVPEVLTDR